MKKLQRLPEPRLDCYAGWLAPDGKLYPCTQYGHMELGMRLMEHYNLKESKPSAFDLPEHYGLIRLSGYQFHPVWQVISEAQLNTIKQYKALHRLGEGNKVPVISLMSPYQLEMLNPVPEDEFLSYIKRKLEKWNST